MINALFGDFDVFRHKSSDEAVLHSWWPDGWVATTCLQKVSARLAPDVPQHGSPKLQDREGGCLLVLVALLVSVVSCTADATAEALSWPRTKGLICLLSRCHIRRTSQSPISSRSKRARTRYKSTIMGGEIWLNLRAIGLSTVHTMWNMLTRWRLPNGLFPTKHNISKAPTQACFLYLAP